MSQHRRRRIRPDMGIREFLAGEGKDPRLLRRSENA